MVKGAEKRKGGTGSKGSEDRDIRDFFEGCSRKRKAVDETTNHKAKTSRCELALAPPDLEASSARDGASPPDRGEAPPPRLSGSFSSARSQPRTITSTPARHKPTKEQQGVIEYEMKPNTLLKVAAGPGTGKSATIVRKVAEEIRKGNHILVTVFGKEAKIDLLNKLKVELDGVGIKGEDGKKYLDQVKTMCAVAHQWAKKKKKWMFKPVPSVLSKDIKDKFQAPYEKKAKIVRQNRLKEGRPIDPPASAAGSKRKQPQFVSYARVAAFLERRCCTMEQYDDSELHEMAKWLEKELWHWAEGKKECAIPHSLLELWLAGDKDYSLEIAAIFVDEAQDVNPVNVAAISQIARKSQAFVLAVGDPSQAIFQFRHCVSIFDKGVWPSDWDSDRKYLTHTFRFGSAICELANLISEPDEVLQPNDYDQTTSVVSTENDDVSTLVAAFDSQVQEDSPKVGGNAVAALAPTGKLMLKRALECASRGKPVQILPSLRKRMDASIKVFEKKFRFLPEDKRFSLMIRGMNKEELKTCHPPPPQIGLLRLCFSWQARLTLPTLPRQVRGREHR